MESTKFSNIKKSADVQKMKLKSQFQNLSKKREIPSNPNSVHNIFNLSLKGIGISFIDSKPQEILYLSATGIDLSLKDTLVKYSYDLKVLFFFFF